MPEPRARRRSTWRRPLCAKWPRAACTISLGAVFIAIRWTPAGSFRTLKRCSTTRRNWPSRMWKRFRLPETRPTAKPLAAFWITCCATCATRTAVSDLKMLYDQAQLAVSYVEAFQITGDASYSQTARGVLDYVLRDMRDPDGGFHSAEDADSVIDRAHPEEKG